jgi:hypothetical protein
MPLETLAAKTAQKPFREETAPMEFASIPRAVASKQVSR